MRGITYRQPITAGRGVCRLLVLLCSIGLPGCDAPGTSNDTGPAYEIEALGDGLHVFRLGSRQSIFLVGSDGVIATDPLNTQAAKLYREAIAEITNLPVKYVVYSNSFFDHVAGGESLAGPGTEFIAHENCAANLRVTPRADIVPPTQTYEDRYEVSAGDVGLTLYYFGPSYGNCLSVMIARPANIMYVSKLVTPPVARVPDDPTLGNYYLHNIVSFYQAVEALAAEQAVDQVVGAFAPESTGTDGGTAAVPILAPVALIAEQRRMWETLLDIARIEYEQKTPARVMQSSTDFERLAPYAGYDPQQVGIMMRRVYSLYRIGR